MLIIVPTAREAKSLFDGPVPTCETPVATRVGAVDVTAALCGFGPAAAGVLSALTLVRTPPGPVALAGICGTFDVDRLPVGALFEALEVRMYGIGRGEGDEHVGPAQTGFAQAPATGALEPVLDRLPLPGGPRAGGTPGVLLTVAAAAGGPREAAWRRRAVPEALAEDMEGFAVALACARLGRSLTVLRGVSNAVGAEGAWDHAAGLAAARAGLARWVAQPE
jgi:futalosine hydrolase